MTRKWLEQAISRISRESRDVIKIFTDYVSDQDRPYYYNLAKVFVYTSFFEGFGFPPLEAMACGTPTISSTNSSIPEVIGKGGLMVNPYDNQHGRRPPDRPLSILINRTRYFFIS